MHLLALPNGVHCVFCIANRRNSRQKPQNLRDSTGNVSRPTEDRDRSSSSISVPRQNLLAIERGEVGVTDSVLRRSEG